MSTPVELYRYDLTGGMAQAMAPVMIGRSLEAVWHTSMVVYGKEYYFDGGVGIVCEPAPGTTRFGEPLRRELLGETAKTEAEFAAWVAAQLRSTFGPNDYHLLERNCNHFTQAASRFLLDKDIPSDVRDMIPTLLNTPMLGMMLRPMLENMIAAPSNDGPSNTNAAPPSHMATFLSGMISFPGDTEEMDEEDWREDFNLAKTMLLSNELLEDVHSTTGVKVTLAALDTLKTVFSRILANPEDSKVRGLSTNSNTYTSNILPLEEYGAEMVLRLAGFRRLPHPTGDGDQWLLSESDMRLSVLEDLVRGLDEVASEVVSSADRPLACPRMRVEVAESIDKNILSYSTFRPTTGSNKTLAVGSENEQVMIAIRVHKGDTTYLGKAVLSPDGTRMERAYYMSGDKEIDLYGKCEVLHIHEGADEAVMWAPAALAYAHATAENDFIYRASGQYGVCRAMQGESMTPGMMEPTGACVVPYGGKAVTVTDTAEVLCITARVPDAVMKHMNDLREGEQIRVNIGKQNGVPIDSFKDLLEWQSPTGTPLPVPALAPRSDASDARGPRLMVCHDMRGGYQPCDNGYYSADDDGKLNGAYTVSYWRYVDDFVYFSHHRVTVPPHEWIAAAHRHGSTALGTLITEGHDGWEDFSLFITDADKRERAIDRLVHLCVYYGFDGYLVNIQVGADPTLILTLIFFIDELRQRLIAARGLGIVMWYDAITIGGYVSFQNALTEQNKPFFDVSDSIMTNYGWSPRNLKSSYTRAGDRCRDVYVGVDVFGRGQYGGGKLNTDVAVRAIADAKLSVGMFAPGWTVEVAGGGSRPKFLGADSRLWASLQPFLTSHALSHTVTDLPLWSCFSSGIGSAYFVNGATVSPSSIYCQLGAAHRTPPFEYIADSADTCQLQSPITATGPVGSWRQDAVWHGDRSLSFTIDPSDGVIVWEDHVSGLSTAEDLVVDIALRGGDVPSVRLDCVSGRFTTYVAMIQSAAASVVDTGADEWRVLRYVLPAVPGDKTSFKLSTISVFNESSNAALPCVLGGVALRLSTQESPLAVGAAREWPAAHRQVYDTMQSTVHVVRLNHISENVKPAAGATEAIVAVVVTLSVGGETSSVYCGQHRVSVSDADAVLDINYAANAAADAVSAVQFYIIGC